MNWIDVNGTSLRYELSGSGKSTLVLVHEMGGTLDSWEQVVPALNNTRQVLRYDTRGAGLSEKIGGTVTFDDMANDLVALLDALQIKGKVALAGTAVGGAIAIHFAVRHAARGTRDFLEVAAAQSGRLAFERAGVSQQEIDLAMVYDSFTITVIVTLENLGFCKPGEGGAFVSGGRLAFDGEFPLNTDGGGLSSNHPGMRGMFLLIEAARQLRGEAGARQVRGCRIALVHGTGGNLGTRHSGATLILSNQAG